MASPNQYVDSSNDGIQEGTKANPWKYLDAAFEALRNATYSGMIVHVAAGVPTLLNASGRNQILKRVCDGKITVAGRKADFLGNASPGEVILDVNSSPMFIHRGGHYHFKQIQAGDYTRRSQNAFYSELADGFLELENVVICTGSLSGSIWADFNSVIKLRKNITLNEDVPSAMQYKQAGLSASNGGRIVSADKGGQLYIGNGSISASEGGSIELGQRNGIYVENDAHQANLLACNGRGSAINMRGSVAELKCSHPNKNHVIGLEHDGGILHENALFQIMCTERDQFIAYQKVSFGLGGKRGIHPGNVLVIGPFGVKVWASTGSIAELMFAFQDNGSVKNVYADTGATLFVHGEIDPSVCHARRGGEVYLNGVKVAG